MKKEELMEHLELTKGVFYVVLGQEHIVNTIIRNGVATADEIKEWRIELITELYEAHIMINPYFEYIGKELLEKRINHLGLTKEKLVGLFNNQKAVDIILNNSNVPEGVIKIMCLNVIYDLYNDLEHVKMFNELVGGE